MAEVYSAYLRERSLHDSEKATEAALNERLKAREYAHGAPRLLEGYDLLAARWACGRPESDSN